MTGVNDDAETFVRSYANVEADKEERKDEDAPPTRDMAETEQNAENDSQDDVRYAGVADEEYTGLVAVANRPANEIGVGLAAEGGFDHVFNERAG